MDTSAAASRRRPRHDPKETEHEILEAAEQLLRERPFREVTVAQIMLRTGLKRPAFYAHFSDLHDLVLRLLGDIGEELFEMSERWLRGSDPRRDVRAALEGVAAVYRGHGPFMQAVVDAAPTDERVEIAYRMLIQSFIEATGERIRSEQLAGTIASEIDAQETARALVWLVERYLSEAFGRSPQDELERVVDVLERIWLATLYSTTAATGRQPARATSSGAVRGLRPGRAPRV
jgi:AcrR family transcriptional regulator